MHAPTLKLRTYCVHNNIIRYIIASGKDFIPEIMVLSEMIACLHGVHRDNISSLEVWGQMANYYRRSELHCTPFQYHPSNVPVPRREPARLYLPHQNSKRVQVRLLIVWFA